MNSLDFRKKAPGLWKVFKPALFHKLYTTENIWLEIGAIYNTRSNPRYLFCPGSYITDYDVHRFDSEEMAQIAGFCLAATEDECHS